MADIGVESLLRELIAWQRLAAQETLLRTLRDAIRTDKDHDVFELLDGTRTQREIAKDVSVTPQAVSLKVKEWRTRGLVFEDPATGLPRHLASIASLGGLPTDDG